MGTARPSTGPLPETPKHRFKDQPDAMNLLHQRRTREWIDRVAANAESGYRTARTFAWVHHNKEWLLSGDTCVHLRSCQRRPAARTPAY